MPRFPSGRGKGEGVVFPHLVLVTELCFNLRAGESFPVAVANLLQTVTAHRREAVRRAEDSDGLHRTTEGAGVRHRDPLPGKSLRQTMDLPAALIREVHPDAARKAIFRRPRRCAVAYEIEACRHHEDFLEVGDGSRWIPRFLNQSYHSREDLARCRAVDVGGTPVSGTSLEAS